MNLPKMMVALLLKVVEMKLFVNAKLRKVQNAFSKLLSNVEKGANVNIEVSML